MILLPARTSQIVRLLMNSHSFSSRTLMEALLENVEWTEMIEVLTPFSGGSISLLVSLLGHHSNLKLTYLGAR